ncbi:MAG: MFS transporter [Gammaproteobacteria bacterium]|nr:MAG: MFS transporter [Gammaproteobacteria bacterium]
MSAGKTETSATGHRIGFLQFAPGINRRNAWTFLYVNLAIMPIVSFLSFSQPYVLTEIVGIAPEKHGQVTGWLTTMHEIVVLALVSYVGGLSDRVGRRPLYAGGTLLTALGFIIYANATGVGDLYAGRFAYAVGLGFVGVMIAVTAADYAAEGARGRMAGTTGVLNGLGIGLATALFAAMPAVFQARGASSADAGRYMLWAMAAVAVVTALVMQWGLQGGTPSGRRARMGLVRVLQIGLRQGRENPRLMVCFAGSFISRADLTLVATFISLWLQRVGRNEGLDAAEAIARAGLMFAMIQGASLLWAPVVGVIVDRVHRLACVLGALVLGGVGYTLLGMQEHPYGPVGFLGCVLVGMGQMSVIISVTALLGQESPLDARGSVIGLAGLCGSLGILATSLAGGYLFDYWHISGPIILVGFANFAIALLALRVWLAEGRPTRFDPREAKSAGMVVDMH